jgi:hypothetical protein
VTYEIHVGDVYVAQRTRELDALRLAGAESLKTAERVTVYCLHWGGYTPTHAVACIQCGILIPVS